MASVPLEPPEDLQERQEAYKNVIGHARYDFVQASPSLDPRDGEGRLHAIDLRTRAEGFRTKKGGVW